MWLRDLQLLAKMATVIAFDRYNLSSESSEIRTKVLQMESDRLASPDGVTISRLPTLKTTHPGVRTARSD